MKNKKIEEDIQKLEKKYELPDDYFQKLEYLKNNIFNGLKNLNNGFDVKDIFYFSESEFEIILNRVEENGIGINGIEPWFNGEYYDVKVVEEYDTTSTDPNWYQNAFAEFRKEKKNLQYAASYFIPKQVLEK